LFSISKYKSNEKKRFQTDILDYPSASGNG